MAEVTLDCANIGTRAVLKSSPRLADRVKNPLAAHGVRRTRHPLAFVSSQTLAAIQTRTESNALNNAEQMLVGIANRIREHESIAGMSKMASAESFGEPV